MSSLAFRPHGLIRNPLQEVLYHRAHIANIYTGIADPKERETSELMRVILCSNIFATLENIIVNSHLPLLPQSDKRCDTVIRYLEQGISRLRVLCFVECQRTRTTPTFSLKALERQVNEYCRLYLDSEEGMEFVYAATVAGAHVRLWKYSRGQTESVPFWGSKEAGDWSQYKDVGDESSGRDIEYHFGQMKQMTPTPYAG